MLRQGTLCKVAITGSEAHSTPCWKNEIYRLPFFFACLNCGRAKRTIFPELQYVATGIYKFKGLECTMVALYLWVGLGLTCANLDLLNDVANTLQRLGRPFIALATGIARRRPFVDRAGWLE